MAPNARSFVQSNQCSTLSFKATNPKNPVETWELCIVVTSYLRLTLRYLVGEERVVGILAKYAFDVLNIFDTVELYFHPALLRPAPLSQ